LEDTLELVILYRASVIRLFLSVWWEKVAMCLQWGGRFREPQYGKLEIKMRQASNCNLPSQLDCFFFTARLRPSFPPSLSNIPPFFLGTSPTKRHPQPFSRFSLANVTMVLKQLHILTCVVFDGFFFLFLHPPKLPNPPSPPLV